MLITAIIRSRHRPTDLRAICVPAVKDKLISRPFKIVSTLGKLRMSLRQGFWRLIDGSRYICLACDSVLIRRIKLRKPANKVSYQIALTFPFKGWICCVQIVLICTHIKSKNAWIFEKENRQVQGVVLDLDLF